MALLKIGKAATYLGCTTQTLRNYSNKGLLPDKRNAANQRIYDTNDLDKLITTFKDIEYSNNNVKVYYARSSEGDKQHLNNQISKLVDNYGEPDHIIKDNGSGLNENRKGLQKLLKLAQSRSINTVYITTQDRLTRFGYSYLEKLLEEYNVKIVILNDTKLSPQEELLQDFMNLIASFSGKFYKMRSIENKKRLLNKALKEVDKNGQQNI